MSLTPLISDPFYFPRASTGNSTAPVLNYVSIESVKQGVRAILGLNFQFTSQPELSSKSTGLPLFDTLSTILPFTSHSSFFWHKVFSSFASMLATANFSLSSQLSFLIFIYARVLGFMGPIDGPNSIMTIDGSPIELSWIIPNRSTPLPGQPTRQIRFAIEPLDPITGMPLLNTEILDFLVREGLGVVLCNKGAMNWRKKAEEFLFPDSDTTKGIKSNSIPEGSRFLVGFDFMPNGTLTLKTYYITIGRAPSASLLPSTGEPRIEPELMDRVPIYCGDIDFSPLRALIPRLDPNMIKSFEKILAYVNGLEDPKMKPRFQILAVDCVDDHANRLKIYCRNMHSTSWSDALRSFTLNHTLVSPAMQNSIKVFESLWNALFPSSSSLTPNRDLGVSKTVDQGHDQESESDLDKVHSQHAVSGLLYYYEIVPRKAQDNEDEHEDEIYPKIYLPVRHYCDSDQLVSEALEAFYESVGVCGPIGGEVDKGWVAREVAKAFNHRGLADRSGIQTYVTFAIKKTGWEVTSYFSPELWV